METDAHQASEKTGKKTCRGGRRGGDKDRKLQTKDPARRGLLLNPCKLSLQTHQAVRILKAAILDTFLLDPAHPAAAAVVRESSAYGHQDQ